MSDVIVIEFLEKLGQDAALRHATRSDLENSRTWAYLGSQIQSAVLAGDQRRLEALLGANTNVACLVHAPNTEEDEGEKTRKAKEDEKEKAA